MMISSRQSQAFRRRFALFRYFPVSALSFYYLLQAYLFLFHDIGRRTKVEHNRILLEKSGGVPSPTLLKSGRDISLNHTTQSSNQSHSSRDHQTEGLVDCGCPDTCTLAALSRQINGLSYSCGKRIEYLQSRHQVSGQAQACRIAANEKVPACSPECDPDLCWSNFLQGNQQSAVTEVNNTVTEISTEHVGRSKAMVIAAVPKDENHAVALWTELECLTGGLDLVVFAVPEWSRDIVEKIANQARHKLGLNIMTRYYVNDRYDVGLWCDALSDISGSFMHAADSIKYESIILLNDSVYALRHFTGIQDRLAQSHGQLDMVSLSYYNESSYWLESVMRGFHAGSISKFMNHACRAKEMRQCTRRAKAVARRKRCIVENFEIAIAKLYDADRVAGLYPSLPRQPVYETKSWVQNDLFWKHVLVEQYDFPVGKVNRPGMIRGASDKRLTTCTRFMDRDFFQKYNYTLYENLAAGALLKK